MMGQASFFRRIYVSCGLSYGRSAWSREQNIEVFGPLFVESVTMPLEKNSQAAISLAGWGRNLAIEAKCVGEIDPETGFSVSLPELDGALKKLSELLDHQYLNQLEMFENRVPSIENVARFCAEFLQHKISLPGRLSSVLVREDEDFYAEYFIDSKDCLVSLGFKISALHRHHNPALTEAENIDIYRKCSRVHGHQYKLDVQMKGSIDEESGAVTSRYTLSKLIDENITKKFSGTFLNNKLGNTSGELILLKFQNILAPLLEKGLFYALSMRETRKNHFTVFQNRVVQLGEG